MRFVATVLLVSLVLISWGIYKRSWISSPQREAGDLIRFEYGVSQTDMYIVENMFLEAYQVLWSKEFLENIAYISSKYVSIYANSIDNEVDPKFLEDRLDRSKKIGMYFPIIVKPVGESPADDLWYQSGAIPDGEMNSYAYIQIGRVVLSEYESSNLVEKSCAIHSASHELSHTISNNRFFLSMLFTDTMAKDVSVPKKRDRRIPIASYLIGSVAQCTYLQINGRIRRSEVSDCVKVFGVSSFNNLRCKSFDHEDPVVDGPHLPPRSPDI